MKRHTTRKKNRRIKRSAHTRWLNALEKVLKTICGSLHEEIVKTVDLDPMIPKGKIFYFDSAQGIKL